MLKTCHININLIFSLNIIFYPRDSGCGREADGCGVAYIIILKINDDGLLRIMGRIM